MKNAPNEEEAFKAYRKLHTQLDFDGYVKVLTAFCDLPFTSAVGDPLRIPSPHLYFQIVQDMRDMNIVITQVVYTILLRQVGDLATRAKQVHTPVAATILEKLMTVVRRTHDLITIDASITPDTHLYNQLLDTYQRLGGFAETCRVWDQMYMSGNYDHISVSVVLDACGYAQAANTAMGIVNRLFKSQFKFNQHNWDTWVECLCRLGHLNDALKVVCLQMGRDGIALAPTANTVRILLSFARKDNLEGEVLNRIKSYLPDVWAKLPDDLKNAKWA
jgi:pentatricopeptide repeat protein